VPDLKIGITAELRDRAHNSRRRTPVASTISASADRSFRARPLPPVTQRSRGSPTRWSTAASVHCG